MSLKGTRHLMNTKENDGVSVHFCRDQALVQSCQARQEGQAIAVIV